MASARHRRLVVIGTWLLLAWQVPLLAFGFVFYLVHFVTGGVRFWIGDSLVSSGDPAAPGRNVVYVIAMILCGGLATVYVLILSSVTRRSRRRS